MFYGGVLMDWNPVFPLCQESLPAVFDDSLSYYEAVCKVAGSFNKLVEYVNTSLEGFVDSSQEYTDEAIAKARKINRNYSCGQIIKK